MNITNLEELFFHELRDLYSAESQILQALPKMIEMASDADLRDGLEKHLEETRGHVERLDEIAEECDFKVTGHTCKAMQGIIAEGEELLKNVTDAATKDAAIIISAQRVEHYEIAAYGSAAAFASELEYGDAESLLRDTLNEESHADETLTGLAEGGIFTTGINDEATDE